MVYEYGHAEIALWASDSGFGNYNSGVFDTCTGTHSGNVKINHAVVITGWGTENGIDYWKIKNSWGANWGDNGYIKIKIGTCGIQYMAASLKCEANGTPEPVPGGDGGGTPEPCNVNHWWNDITGTHYLESTGPTDGKFRKVKCNCQHGLCVPVDLPEGANSCEVICGVNPCKQEGDATPKCKFPKWKGDGYCDDENNNANTTPGCAYDGGDCCGPNVKKNFCKACECLEPPPAKCGSPHWKGDGYCDDENNNANTTPGCKYDGGDCCGTNVRKNFCKECKCLDPNGKK